jgi:hypothetical protein
MMTNRRTFLGSTLAATALGWIGLKAKRQPAPPPRVEFFALRPTAADPRTSNPILGNSARQLGTPESVELRTVRVGHFHGLIHEGGGRVAYMYEASIPGDRPRRGLVKLGAEATFA